MIFDDPPLTPDAPTARQWVREELSKSEYHAHKSLLDRILDWLSDHLGGASVAGVGIPWWIPALAVLAVFILLAVMAGKRYSSNLTRPEKPTSTDTSPQIDVSQGAEHYRALAEQALDADPDAALLAAYRATVARAAENALVQLTPATTVGDINDHLSRTCPHLSAETQNAGGIFAAVRYGRQHASRASVEKVLRLDDEMRKASLRPGMPGATSLTGRSR